MTSDPRVGQADACYAAQDWRGALALYVGLVGADPVAPLAAFHCCVELADDGVLARLPPPPAMPGSERLTQVVGQMLGRALDLCRAGAFARAAALLRAAANQDPAIGTVYLENIDAAPGPPQPWWPEPTPFRAAEGFADLDLARSKATFHGKKVLSVAPRVFLRMHYQHADRLRMSATAFGLEWREFNTMSFGRDMQALIDALAEALASWSPDVVLVENLATLDWAVSPEREPAGGFLNAVRDLLRQARRRGARVAAIYPDAWYLSDEQLYGGLGDTIDVISHVQATRLPTTPEAARAQVLCYIPPIIIATPTAVPDSIARFCFSGSVVVYSISRLVWWAELKRLDLPVDFFETPFNIDLPRTDEEFVNLLTAYRGTISFTNRRNRGPALTGRSIETMLAGGMLIEEAGADAAYFFEPGVHYLPFATLGELQAVMARLTDDPALGTRIRAAGAAWARHYFSGDFYWAGLLAKAFG